MATSCAFRLVKTLSQRKSSNRARRKAKVCMRAMAYRSISGLRKVIGWGSIPCQNHSTLLVIPRNNRPLGKPIAIYNNVFEQRKQSRTKRIYENLRILIPHASNICEGFQAIITPLVAKSHCRRPFPRFRPLMVRCLEQSGLVSMSI